MDIKCNSKVTYEKETHDRLTKIAEGIQADDSEVEMLNTLNHIIGALGFWAMQYNVPQILLEISPKNHDYPIYGDLDRSVNLNRKVEAIVIPNNSKVLINVEIPIKKRKDNVGPKYRY